MQLGLQYILWCQQKRFFKAGKWHVWRNLQYFFGCCVVCEHYCWKIEQTDFEHFFSYHWHEAFFVLNGLIGSSKNVIVIFLVSEYWTSTWVYQCLNEGLSFLFKWQLLHPKYVAAIDFSSFLLHLKKEKYEFMVVISNISPSMVVDTNCVVSWVSGTAKTSVKSPVSFISVPYFSSVQINVVMIFHLLYCYIMEHVCMVVFYLVRKILPQYHSDWSCRVKQGTVHKS